MRSDRAGTDKAEPGFYTVAQVAERLQVSEKTVRRRIDAGELTAHRFKRLLRISIADFESFLRLSREG